MPGFMRIRVEDVEHGCCVMLQHVIRSGLGQEQGGRLAMIDSGSSTDFKPSTVIKSLGRDTLDYLFITNADQDHMSDLKGLEDAGIYVETLIRNPSYTSDQIWAVKRAGGPLTRDAEWYVNACETYTGGPPVISFDHGMGGITYKSFWNSYGTGPGQFTDTNNLSLVIFIKYGNFKMLFPGDMERAGWLELLKRSDFRAELAGTEVLMASHHGRENGFCEEIFEYFSPSCVVISDKAMEHKTQDTVPDYRKVITAQGVKVRTTMKYRHVLTTRRDGHIVFDVDGASYTIDTEYCG
jgi:beta-lactamase superfamily II metal-dependent hydrolase